MTVDIAPSLLDNRDAITERPAFAAVVVPIKQASPPACASEPLSHERLHEIDRVSLDRSSERSTAGEETRRWRMIVFATTA